MRDYFDSLALQSRLAPASSSRSPRAVFEKLISGITAQNWDELPMLYAENAVVTHPHDLPVPTRQQGRDQLRAHFAHAATLPITMQTRNVIVHETADLEVIVAEYDYLGRVTTTGHTFQVSNILVMRVRNGEIVESRDYGDRVAFAHALDALPELFAKFERWG
jgi:ketosteroid isomerase-like protein